MEIEDGSGVQDLQPRTSLGAPSDKSTMVGLDDELIQILEWLERDSLQLDTLSIVGMAGIGKTTFARKVYDHQRIQMIFHIRVWVTVSQKYNERKIVLDLLDSMKKLTDEMHKETSDLKQVLYQNLKGWRYLIIMDDIWDTEVWNDIRCLFPDDKNRSRIMLTTRLESVAVHVNSNALHRMRFLNDDESWNLFCEKVFGATINDDERWNLLCKKVFGEDCCPRELNQIGTKIAKDCRGLPLAIVLIGGLLSKSTKTQSYWEYVVKNLSSFITSNDDQCKKIMDLSYDNLPDHLRVCFRYMGIFPEDYEILVSKLVKLWIAEGFIEPVTSKSLEDVAEEYLLNLVERSLILVSKRSSKGKTKMCKIHDLLHELCVREARKESFFHVTDRSLNGLPKDISTSHVTGKSLYDLPTNFISLRRLSIHPNTETNFVHAESLPTSTVRSVLNFDPMLHLSVEFLNSRLLRVLDVNSFDIPTEILKLVNLRYLACASFPRKFPSSLYKLRNLQILILRCTESSFDLPPEIWRMPQLRHVHLDKVNLLDPPKAGVEEEHCLTILEDLQTLSTVINFRCTEDILRRIPSLKKLGILYADIRVDWSDYYLNNLARLQNLEALKCLFDVPYPPFLQNLTFPTSLKKLTLRGSFLPWKDITIIGSLPNLQVLKLKRNAFSGLVWEPKEEQFLQLTFLLLEENNMKEWKADRIHFPKLQHLILHKCRHLIEVPCGIGDIPTLQKIELYYCSNSLVNSAKNIYEEQCDEGNKVLQVRIVEMPTPEF
ncbi:Disease resistance RPP8-like protein 3 [Abeliophyllum distichum]|uniref:Disease resistance RPP8-like protein 3 n=2 Tax=Abeliophyllum distichum TaxID=126358 RepID=A0ABD1PMA5_9LAMI